MKSRVLITGAAGGMGRACARVFGATQELVLTDFAARPLEEFAEELRADGYGVIAAHAGDLCDHDTLAALANDLAGDAPITLLHTAGLSPSQADWQSIVRVNLVATASLLQVVEPLLCPGSVGILIASTAGHMVPPIPDAQAILDVAQAEDLLEKIAPLVEAMGEQAGPAGTAGVAYSLSKQAVLRMCEQRARAWGQSGARILSISPGLILTPMGRKELAETPGADQLRDAAPVGRSGTAMDIALAARFLASGEASFITGTDLRVDGGSIAAMRFAQA